MVTTAELALMSSNVYANSELVVNPVNALPIPLGWQGGASTDPTMFARNDETGFLARAYTRTAPGGATEIVIAYGGTTWESLVDWETGNVAAATASSLAEQIVAAARFYLDLRRLNQDASITFTGHSMGGGLASLMAVFFNQSATTFDPAPFGLSADSPLRVEDLRALLLSLGYENDPAYAPLQTYVPGQQDEGEGQVPTPSPTRLDRQSLVTSVVVRGELLSSLLPSSFRQVSGTELPLGPMLGSYEGWIGQAFDLHSMTLLNAFLASTEFQSASQTQSALLKELFNSPIYDSDLESEERSLLELLVQRHVQGEGSLAHIAADAIKIQSGGLSGDLNVRSALFNAMFAGYYSQGKERQGTFVAEFQEVVESVTGGDRRAHV